MYVLSITYCTSLSCLNLKMKPASYSEVCKAQLVLLPNPGNTTEAKIISPVLNIGHFDSQNPDLGYFSVLCIDL